MDTKVLLPTEENIGYAGCLIANGQLVAFPTETVYGLGADAMNEEAVRKIFEAKDRPPDKALILHIAHTDQMYEAAKEVPDMAKELAERFWPGPLTLVLKKNSSVPDITTGGKDTVALRMPDNKVARLLVIRSESPIAAPSANISGQPSPKTAADVLKGLDGRIDAVIDGGETSVGVESTIVDLTSGRPRILRHGAIKEEDIMEVTNNGPDGIPEDKKRQCSRVVFVDGNGVTRAPMASALFSRLFDGEIKVLCRGIRVPFPEPLNQKTEAVMISNGITLEEFTSKKLENEEIIEDTLIFAMEESERKKIIRDFENATEENTFLLSDFVGDELEIMDPYGGTLQTYGICFEVIKNSIEKMKDKISVKEA